MKFRLQQALAVHFEHAAGGEPAEQRGADFGRIDAGLARERERFADRGERAADHELIARLADLPGAGLADVDDAFGVPHRLEHRPHALERRARRRPP